MQDKNTEIFNQFEMKFPAKKFIYSDFTIDFHPFPEINRKQKLTKLNICILKLEIFGAISSYCQI